MAACRVVEVEDSGQERPDIKKILERRNVKLFLCEFFKYVGGQSRLSFSLTLSLVFVNQSCSGDQ